MHVAGTVTRIVYDDKDFAVVVIDDSGQQLRVSGRFPALMPSMPLVGEIEKRTHAVYGEQWRLVSCDDPGRGWRRSAGVWAWLAAGALGISYLAQDLAQRQGEHLADAFTRVDNGLIETLKELGVEATLFSAYAHVIAAETAAMLGERELWWVPGRLVERFGTDGPTLTRSALGALLADPSLPLLAFRALVEGEDGGLIAASALKRLRRTFGEPVVSRRFLLQHLTQAIGDGAEDALRQGLDHGWLLPVPGGGLVEADVVREERLAQLLLSNFHVAARRRANEANRGSPREPFGHGVTLVDLPPGADHRFVVDAVRGFQATHSHVAVLTPDRRPSLSGTPVAGLPLSECPLEDASVVLVLDAHRMPAQDLGRVAIDARAADRLILIGDAWLWAPGDGTHTFGDLVRLRAFPSIQMEGHSRSAALRRSHTRVADLPGCNYGMPNGPWLRLWPKEPSAPMRKIGTQCVLLEEHGGYGPGTTGVLHAMFGTICAIRLPDGNMIRVSRSTCSSDVAVGWLPGVKTERLVIGGSGALSREVWYAALQAADELWSGDRDSFPCSDRPSSSNVLEVPLPMESQI